MAKFKVGDKIILDKKWADSWSGFDQKNYIYTIKTKKNNIFTFMESGNFAADEKHLRLANSHIIKERLGIK